MPSPIVTHNFALKILFLWFNIMMNRFLLICRKDPNDVPIKSLIKVLSEGLVLEIWICIIAESRSFAVPDTIFCTLILGNMWNITITDSNVKAARNLSLR
ncbi:hypothetical protein MRB53_013656 [Persea americana]|uniref:Uncharacterized protein n=1 Tax=Persea americana TaxID=3435 RepID=A0ACC2K8L3_PERAE|nr:hypothetical protein MRB53_013656 [Persea americana]